MEARDFSKTRLALAAGAAVVVGAGVLYLIQHRRVREESEGGAGAGPQEHKQRGWFVSICEAVEGWVPGPLLSTMGQQERFFEEWGVPPHLIEQRIARQYRGKGMLGEGGYAKVVGAQLRTPLQLAGGGVLSKGTDVAIKIIETGDFSATSEALRECEVLKMLTHKHIMRLFDFVLTTKHLYIVTERAFGGDLFDAIMKRDSYNEEIARQIFRNLVDAVKYLHDNNIFHRDIKPENILVSSTDPDCVNIKLCDFGIARVLDESDRSGRSKRKHGRGGRRSSRKATVRGTAEYMPPEATVGGAWYSYPADIWALGVVLVVMLTGEMPRYKQDESSGEQTAMLDGERYVVDLDDDSPSGSDAHGVKQSGARERAAKDGLPASSLRVLSAVECGGGSSSAPATAAPESPGGLRVGQRVQVMTWEDLDGESASGDDAGGGGDQGTCTEQADSPDQPFGTVLEVKTILDARVKDLIRRILVPRTRLEPGMRVRAWDLHGNANKHMQGGPSHSHSTLGMYGYRDARVERQLDDGRYEVAFVSSSPRGGGGSSVVASVGGGAPAGAGAMAPERRAVVTAAGLAPGTFDGLRLTADEVQAHPWLHASELESLRTNSQLGGAQRKLKALQAARKVRRMRKLRRLYKSAVFISRMRRYGTSGGVESQASSLSPSSPSSSTPGSTPASTPPAGTTFLGGTTSEEAMPDLTLGPPGTLKHACGVVVSGAPGDMARSSDATSNREAGAGPGGAGPGGARRDGDEAHHPPLGLPPQLPPPTDHVSVCADFVPKSARILESIPQHAHRPPWDNLARH